MQSKSFFFLTHCPLPNTVLTVDACQLWCCIKKIPSKFKLFCSGKHYWKKLMVHAAHRNKVLSQQIFECFVTQTKLILYQIILTADTFYNLQHLC